MQCTTVLFVVVVGGSLVEDVVVFVVAFVVFVVVVVVVYIVVASIMSVNHKKIMHTCPMCSSLLIHIFISPLGLERYIFLVCLPFSHFRKLTTF